MVLIEDCTSILWCMSICLGYSSKGAVLISCNCLFAHCESDSYKFSWSNSQWIVVVLTLALNINHNYWHQCSHIFVANVFARGYNPLCGECGYLFVYLGPHLLVLRLYYWLNNSRITPVMSMTIGDADDQTQISWRKTYTQCTISSAPKLSSFFVIITHIWLQFWSHKLVAALKGHMQQNCQ